MISSCCWVWDWSITWTNEHYKWFHCIMSPEGPASEREKWCVTIAKKNTFIVMVGARLLSMTNENQVFWEVCYKKENSGAGTFHFDVEVEAKMKCIYTLAVDLGFILIGSSDIRSLFFNPCRRNCGETMETECTSLKVIWHQRTSRMSHQCTINSARVNLSFT